MDLTSISMEWYTSIPGIAGAAFLAGEATKRWLWDVPGLRTVPLVLLVMGYAGLFTAIAWGVMHAIDGDPWQIGVKALTAAALAVGGRSMIANVTKPLEATGRRDFLKRASKL